MDKEIHQSRKRKTLSAIVAIAMVLTMLLSGTLAYFYQSKATNVFSNSFKEAYGHDDFIEGVNKDVYVENTGNSIIYVRVKLQETLKIKDGMGNITVGKLVHKPSSTGSVVKTGSAKGDSAAEGNIHSYFTWEYGVGAVEQKAFKSALSDDYVNSATSKLIIEDKVAKDSSGVIYTDDGADDDILLTDETQAVITMYDYMHPTRDDGAGGNTAITDPAEIKQWQQNFKGWVMDNADGWIYWTQPVEPQHATGLLLTNVEVLSDKLARKNYQYDIDVNFQAVDETDIGIWIAGLNIDEDNHYIGEGQKASTNAITLISNMRAQNTTGDYARLTAALDEAESEAVKTLYQAALKNMNGSKVNGETFWRELEAKAIAAERLLTDETKDWTEVIIQVDDSGNVILPKKTDGSGNEIPAMDAELARYLLDTYAAPSAKEMTREDALAVYEVRIPEDSSYVITQGFMGLTGTDFPSLISFVSKSNALQVEEPQFEESLKPQLINICFNNNEYLKSLDLNGCTRLVWLDAGNCANLAKLDGLSESLSELDGIDMYNTQVPCFDYSRLPFKTFSTLGINSNFCTGEYGTSNLNLLKDNQSVQRLYIEKDVKETQIDLSGMSNLALLYFRNNDTVERIKLSPDAFGKQQNSPVQSVIGGRVMGLRLLNNTKLKYLDISICKGYYGSANLAGSTSLLGVTRRWNQEKFDNYPKDHTVYERIMQEGGGYLYQKHTYDATAKKYVVTETDKAAIASEQTSMTAEQVDAQIFGDE